ncbi:hypothetical protein PSPO01_12721 [Paraphaeosphaeria sporulosa]
MYGVAAKRCGVLQGFAADTLRGRIWLAVTDVFQKASETSGSTVLPSQVSRAHPANQPRVSQSPVLSDSFLETTATWQSRMRVRGPTRDERTMSLKAHGQEEDNGLSLTWSPALSPGDVEMHASSVVLPPQQRTCPRAAAKIRRHRRIWTKTTLVASIAKLDTELQRRRKRRRTAARLESNLSTAAPTCVRAATVARPNAPAHRRPLPSIFGQSSTSCALRLAEAKGCPLQLPPALETVCSSDQRATPVAHPLQPQRKRRRAAPHNNTHGARPTFAPPSVVPAPVVPADSCAPALPSTTIASRQPTTAPTTLSTRPANAASASPTHLRGSLSPVAPYCAS